MCAAELRLRAGMDQPVLARRAASADGSLMIITWGRGLERTEGLRLTGACRPLIRSRDVGMRRSPGGVECSVVLLVAVTSAVRWTVQLAGATVRARAERIGGSVRSGRSSCVVRWHQLGLGFDGRGTNLMGEGTLPYDTGDAVAHHGLGWHRVQFALPPGVKDGAGGLCVDVVGLG